MTKSYRHWCPNGCGKKVIYTSKWVGFTCRVCNENFDKGDLDG